MPLRPRKTAQIVGAAPSLTDCPVIEGAERWIFNASFLMDGGKSVDRVFNLHARAMILGTQPHAWAWYARQTCPVYLIEPHEEIPTSVAFPLDMLQSVFASDQHHAGVEPEICFSCSLDYLIAFALLEGFEHIDLVGCEVRSEEEYTDQRASVQYWMGRARGMGRVLTTTRSSGLGTVPILYGFNRVTGAPWTPGQPMPLHGQHPHSAWPVPALQTTTA